MNRTKRVESFAQRNVMWTAFMQEKKLKLQSKKKRRIKNPAFTAANFLSVVKQAAKQLAQNLAPYL